MFVKTSIIFLFILSALVGFSQGEWAQDFAPDEDIEFHKIDSAFWGEEVEFIKYINQKDTIEFFVRQSIYDEHIETGYLKNGLYVGHWRRYDETGEVNRSLDFDSLTIQADDILRIAEENGFDLDVYEIDFRFDDHLGEESLKNHWIISRDYYEHVEYRAISGISIDAVSGNESDYYLGIHENHVLPDYDTPPSFNGLYRSLEEFIASNSRLPISHKPEAKNAVYVTFKVGADGALREISTWRANSGAYKREAQRLVEIMPDWLPARRNGKAVECDHYGIQINFE